MKIVTLNTRGLRDQAKRHRVQSFLISGKFDICLLQETKCVSVDSKFLTSLWEGEDVDWLVKESNGLSGGMISLWKEGLFRILFHF